MTSWPEFSEFQFVDAAGVGGLNAAFGTVSGALAGIDGFILDSQQYADLETGRFFLRIVFTGQGVRFPASVEGIRAALAEPAARFGFDWHVAPAAERPRIPLRLVPVKPPLGPQRLGNLRVADGEHLAQQYARGGQARRGGAKDVA